MKKVLYLATMLLCMAFTSCQKEDIGGTATESLLTEKPSLVPSIF